MSPRRNGTQDEGFLEPGVAPPIEATESPMAKPFEFDRHEGFNLENAIIQAISAVGVLRPRDLAEVGNTLLSEVRAMLQTDLNNRLTQIGIRNTAVELAAQASSNSYQGDLMELAKRIEAYIRDGAE